jgi:Fur family peroxide stress response transcriptional regulator
MPDRTAKRRTIVRVLKRTKSHPTAEWIYEQAKEEVPGLGLATVYRTLRLLRKQGEVLELHSSDGSVHYDGDTRIHYHFCCDVCGRIVDIDAPVDTTIEDRIEASSGFQVTGHRLMATGVCPDCLRLQADERDLGLARENELTVGLGRAGAGKPPATRKARRSSSESAETRQEPFGN